MACGSVKSVSGSIVTNEDETAVFLAIGGDYWFGNSILQ